MDSNQILDAMEEAATAVFEDNEDYINDGKRGVLAVYTQNENNTDQWDGSLRNFGASFRDYGYDDGLVSNNGVNFDALVHGKIAFSRRSGKDSGTNYYQVLGNESWWKGAVISDDSRCICAFAGFSGEDDRAIALAGIGAYESQKPAAEDKKEAKTGSLLKTASLVLDETDQDDTGQGGDTGSKPSGSRPAKSAGAKPSKKSVKAKAAKGKGSAKTGRAAKKKG